MGISISDAGLGTFEDDLTLKLDKILYTFTEFNKG